MLEELIDIRDIILKEMPQKGEPLREVLDKLDLLIDEILTEE